MDNRITKKRLGELFGYDWLILVVIILLVVLVSEFLFGFFATRVTTGQYFKILYDEDIYYESFDLLANEFEKDKTLSYDVIMWDAEDVVKNTNILRQRYAIQEGDLLITHQIPDESGKTRIGDYVDEFFMYAFEDLFDDGLNYIESFLKDEYGELDDESKKQKAYDFNNLDKEKIKAHFSERMKKDNRYRWDEEKKALGVIDEYGRIERLCKEVRDFETVLTEGKKIGLFYEYTLYKQTVEHPLTEKEGKEYEPLYQEQINNGRENLSYGLKAEKLSGGIGKFDPSAFFKIEGNSTAKDVVILVYDFLKYQPDLQFETISALNTIVRACSNILD